MPKRTATICSSRGPILGLCISILLCNANAVSQDASPAAPTHKPQDSYGDTIPYRATVRLGTQRYRLQKTFQAVVGFSPTEENLVTFDDWGVLRWWDPHTGTQLRQLDLNKTNWNRLPFEMNGKTLTILNSRRKKDGATKYLLRCCDLTSGEIVQKLDWTEKPNVIAQLGPIRGFATDLESGRVLLSRTGIIQPVDLRTGQFAVSIERPENGFVQTLAIAPDSQSIAYATYDSLFVFRNKAWAEIEDSVQVTSLQFSPDSSQLAIARKVSTRESPIRIIDIQTKETVRSIRPPFSETFAASSLVFSNDGRFLAAANTGAGKYNALFVWDTSSGKIEKKFPSAGGKFLSVTFDKMTRRISATTDSAIEVWDFETERKLNDQFVGHLGAVNGVAFAGRSGQAVTISDDGTARIWEANTGKPLKELRHDGWVRAIAISPDEKWIACSSMDGKVKIWNRNSRSEVQGFDGHGTLGGSRELAFNVDGTQLASWGDDMRLQRWDMQSGKRLLSTSLKPRGLQIDDEDLEMVSQDAVFSDDAAKLLLTISGRSYLYDATDGKEVNAKFTSRPVGAACFAGNGTQLIFERPVPVAQPTDQGEMVLVDLENNQEIWRYGPVERDQMGTGPIAASPDGKYFAVAIRAKKSHRILFLDAKTGKSLGSVNNLRWLSPSRSASAISFSTDSKSFAACMSDTTVLIWKLNDIDIPSK